MAEVPEEDTVPLKRAKKGDLIALPAYPGAGVYSGTKDVRGQESFEMRISLISNVSQFTPSVLIGSPGQEITLTGFDDESSKQRSAGTVNKHDFRISDTPEFSSEHEIVGEQWIAHKGTEFSLTFPESGSIAWYCSYHLRLDMAGMLIVKDPM